MEDLMGALTSMLNSPEGAEKIRGIAEALMSDSQSADDVPSLEKSSFSLPDISPNEISTMMKLLSTLKNEEDDKTANLLYALKPHLSIEKQEKVDKAVKLIRLYKLIPLIKEGGFF